MSSHILLSILRLKQHQHSEASDEEPESSGEVYSDVSMDDQSDGHSDGTGHELPIIIP